ncbi:NDR1/HIN1-like protein 6 [Phoenix dactylifera]|uniref:NDR1/HIN1-like protein 6 n=1 Tax=Phoenix dactylifera TaxID=42345 RepID=A0A8B7CN84_PHODC|nr:NDR1/HIN1-like protein 6 [Phoenix dactylifera]
MAEHQRIHPEDVEAPPPSAPPAPGNFSQSAKRDAGDQRAPLPQGTTIPVAHAKPTKKKRSCCCRCLCWTILTIIVLIILVAATAGILYLIFDPKIPKYSVDRLSISAFDVDNNMTVRAGFDVTVTARNPNKKIGIYYEDGSYLSVWYTDSSLCNGSFPEFYQGHRNTTVLNVTLTGETQLGSEILTELQQQQQTGTIPLLFKGDVPVRVKFGSLKLWKMTFRVRCNLVVNSLSASNKISIKSSSCKFKLKL